MPIWNFGSGDIESVDVEKLIEIKDDAYVLGVDPSLTSTGLCLLSMKDVVFGNITSKAEVLSYYRYSQIPVALENFLAGKKVKYVVIESPLVGLRAGPAAFAVTMFMLSTFESLNLPVFFIHPSRLRSFVQRGFERKEHYENYIVEMLKSFGVGKLKMDVVDALLLAFMFIESEVLKDLPFRRACVKKGIEYVDPFTKYFFLRGEGSIEIKTKKVEDNTYVTYKIGSKDPIYSTSIIGGDNG